MTMQKIGFGFQADDDKNLQSKQGGRFGLNQNAKITEFELNTNAGKDQAEANASGCSIDASVHYIQSLENKYNVDLLDKMNVSYKQGEYIAYKELKDFKKMAKERAVSKNTIVFNNLVATKQDYIENWEVPASESWHSRFM